MSRASLDVLTIREYWTPAEAALVLGRGRDFWSARYDAGDVSGYTEGRARFLSAASARDYLAALCGPSVPAGPTPAQIAKESVRAFQAKQRARYSKSA